MYSKTENIFCIVKFIYKFIFNEWNCVSINMSYFKNCLLLRLRKRVLVAKFFREKTWWISNWKQQTTFGQREKPNSVYRDAFSFTMQHFWLWKEPFCCRRPSRRLGALASYATGQLDVLGHDGHALGVDGRQVGVLEQAHQVRLARLLHATATASMC